MAVRVGHPVGARADLHSQCVQQFPQLAIANKLAQQLTRLEQDFGMTPSARTQVQVTPPPRTGITKWARPLSGQTTPDYSKRRGVGLSQPSQFVEVRRCAPPKQVTVAAGLRRRTEACRKSWPSMWPISCASAVSKLLLALVAVRGFAVVLRGRVDEPARPAALSLDDALLAGPVISRAVAPCAISSPRRVYPRRRRVRSAI